MGFPYLDCISKDSDKGSSHFGFMWISSAIPYPLEEHQGPKIPFFFFRDLKLTKRRLFSYWDEETAYNWKD